MAGSSNTEEISQVIEALNIKIQLLVNKIYAEDYKAYSDSRIVIEKMLDKEDHIEPLQTIKESFGRKSLNISKNSSGLNSWLKELNIDYGWVNDKETDWAKLVITGFGSYKQK